MAIFCNGLPLGMVWGLVVWYLEGRLTSELLLAALACSYIVSSGAVKDVGRYLMSAYGVSEAAMPMVDGLLFLPPFLLSVWLLSQLPPPTAADQAARAETFDHGRRQPAGFLPRPISRARAPADARLLTTAFRDFRDNYGVEMFGALGYHGDPTLFTRTEIPVAFGVMAALALLNLIRSNRAGVVGAHVLMMAGLVLMALGTLLLDAGHAERAWLDDPGGPWLVHGLCAARFGGFRPDHRLDARRRHGRVRHLSRRRHRLHGFDRFAVAEGPGIPEDGSPRFFPHLHLCRRRWGGIGMLVGEQRLLLQQTPATPGGRDVRRRSR